jgi:hypothetical protein
MPVFYRGPRALITHEVIEVPYVTRRRFAIKDLGAVYIVEHPSARSARQRLYGVTALGSIFVTVPVVGQMSPVLAVFIMIGSLTYAGACLRIAGAQWQLVAVDRGVIMVLFQSTDQREFDEVSRGLVRALEHHRDSA